MKKTIILLVIAFFAINVNAQTNLKKHPRIVMSADSLINNYLTVITNSDVQLLCFDISTIIDKYAVSIKNYTGELSSKQIRLIKKVSPGKKVVFENIKARNNAGKVVEIKDICIFIK